MMTSKIYVVFAFGVGCIAGWICSNLNDPYVVRDVAQAYVGDIRRIDLAEKSSRFWISRDLSRQCRDLRTFVGAKTRSGRETKILRFKGDLNSHAEFALLRGSVDPLLKDYRDLLASQFSIDLNYTLDTNVGGFTLIVELEER